MNGFYFLFIFIVLLVSVGISRATALRWWPGLEHLKQLHSLVLGVVAKRPESGTASVSLYMWSQDCLSLSVGPH